jgi:hypothetical protein
VEESERRIEALRTCIADAERSLNDLGYLFTAEEDRLRRIFDKRKEEFLRSAAPRARSEFTSTLRSEKTQGKGTGLRERAIELAHDISMRWLDHWHAESLPAAEALYEEATGRFVELANGFLERLAGSGESAVSELPRVVKPEAGFRTKTRLYYTWLMTETVRTPLAWFLDNVRAREQELQVLDREIGGYLERLICVNAHRIVGDFNDRVVESRRRLQSEIRTLLREVSASAERALERANECRAQGSRSVRTEMERLDDLSSRREKLGSGRGGSVS